MDKMEERKKQNSMNFIDLDNENIRQRKELKKKLDGFEKRKIDIDEKNKQHMAEIMEKERHSIEKVNDKKKKQEEEKHIYHNNILKYHSNVIKRGDIKESSTELSRSSA